MKRFYSIIIFVLLASASLFSQKFGGGMFAGPVVSQVDGDSQGGYNKLGVHFGGFVDRAFNDNFGWQMEIKYIQKGSRKVPDLENGDIEDFKIGLHYIEVPCLGTYYLNENITIELGIAAGYLFKANIEDQGYQVPDAIDDFHIVEISGLAGAYYNFNEKLSVGARGSYSLLPIRPHPGGQTYWLNMGQYNNLLSAALYFHIGKR